MRSPSPHSLQPLHTLSALLWFCVASLLVALRLLLSLCSAEAGQWLQQRVQVLVKSLQVQRRQWTLRRAASRDRSADGDDQDDSADPEGGSEPAPAPAPAEDGDGAPQGDAGSSGGGVGGGGGTSLAGRLLRQYTGPGGAAAPLRRLKQRLFGSAASLSLSGRMSDMRGPHSKEPSDGDGGAAAEEPAGGQGGAAPPPPPPPAPEEPEPEECPGARRPSLLRGCTSLPERLDASADGSPQSDLTGSKESVIRNVLAAPVPSAAPPHRRPPSIVLLQPDGAVAPSAEQEDGGGGGGAPPPAPRCPSKLLPLQLHPVAGPGPGPGPHDPAAPGADGAAPARKSPVTVQEWVDSLPVEHNRSEEEAEEPPLEDGEDALDLGLGAEAGLLYNGGPTLAVISPQQLAGAPGADAGKAPLRRDGLAREPSVQSDVTSHGSHGSSVESYLEARKPDPEEVLLSLGFGGPVSSLDSEVSRIPRRFLQPSQVKGVAIKDFLRHQQELIENFETGFCGYRGLTGSSSSMPSVIVSKIMEKLREHERESIHSAATSEYASLATTPPPELGRRFSHHGAYHHHHSHHHRHMLKRGSAPGSSSPSLSPRNTSTLSVLNADNRRFLESQGSKSPEVPRKRMIIGQRSFTFGRDGDLIEVVSPSSLPQESSIPVPLPPLKPLVHKDSVLSSATDLSLTSIDSDSDTDDKSESYERRRQLRLTNSSILVPETTSTPLPASYTESSSSSPILSSLSELDSEKLGISRFSQRPAGIGKRMSSTSLSSWESDANISPSHISNSVFETSVPRNKGPVNDNEPKEEPKFKSSHSLLSNRPLRYESIEEDVEMRIDTDSLPSSVDNDVSLSKNSDYCDVEEIIVDDDPDRKNAMFSFSNSCTTPQVPTSNDSVNNQTRRGSLKRQQKIAEEEALEILSGSLSSPQTMENKEKEESKLEHGENESLSGCETPFCENGLEEGRINVPSLLQDQETMDYIPLEITEKTDMETDNVFEEEVTSPDEGTSSSASPAFPLHNSEKEDFENPSASGRNSESSSMLGEGACVQALRGLRGDSFEMEEIGVTEDERRLVTLSRARSDSSGFLEGDLGERSPSDNSDSRDWERNKSRSEDFPVELEGGSAEEDLLKCSTVTRQRGSSAGTVVPASEGKPISPNMPANVGKRLSLPVVCVSDEQGGKLVSRSSSLRSMSSDETNTSGGSCCEADRKQRRKHRIPSAPDALTLTSSCSSVSNMFSSCSDESVIHVEPCGQHCAGPDRSQNMTSQFCSNMDLQELLEELAERGVSLSQDFDLPALSSHLENQHAPLQADAVRAALGTYSSQLVEGAASLQAHPDLLECGLEAQHELQLLQDIREQIAAELRRVATLLEEHPGPRAAAITRQMTMLLREQTRLCQQLEALSHGSFDSSLCMDIAPRTLSVSTTTPTPVPCCNSEQLLGAVREENRRLERLVQGHSQELAEIRLLLRELVTKQNK